jgi:hypothetical protein
MVCTPNKILSNPFDDTKKKQVRAACCTHVAARCIQSLGGVPKERDHLEDLV